VFFYFFFSQFVMNPRVQATYMARGLFKLRVGGFTTPVREKQFDEEALHLRRVILDPRAGLTCFRATAGLISARPFIESIVRLATQLAQAAVERKKIQMQHLHESSALRLHAGKKQIRPATAAPSLSRKKLRVVQSSDHLEHLSVSGKRGTHLSRFSRSAVSLNEDEIAARSNRHPSVEPQLVSMSSRRAIFAMRALDSRQVAAWEPSASDVNSLNPHKEVELGDSDSDTLANSSSAAVPAADPQLLPATLDRLARFDAAAAGGVVPGLLPDVDLDEIDEALSATASTGEHTGELDSANVMTLSDDAVWADFLGEWGVADVRQPDASDSLSGAALRPGSVSPA
jgi:hypothetical protein